jgi:hypothetical protein
VVLQRNEYEPPVLKVANFAICLSAQALQNVAAVQLTNRMQLLKASNEFACLMMHVYQDYIQDFIEIGHLISLSLASAIESGGGEAHEFR